MQTIVVNCNSARKKLSNIMVHSKVNKIETRFTSVVICNGEIKDVHCHSPINHSTFLAAIAAL